uniref:DUF2828 domain-containing protein n=1 Tax=Lotharella globosa TaxID=91324 RepID=A0A7S4DK63_9EUKA
MPRSRALLVAVLVLVGTTTLLFSSEAPHLSTTFGRVRKAPNLFRVPPGRHRIPVVCAQNVDKNFPELLTEETEGMAALGFTENGAVTYKTTKSACLDLFFDTVPTLPEDLLLSKLELAWAEDPLITLRAIFQLGDVRKGKQQRDHYYRSLMWLYRHHPDTFLLNAEFIPKHSSLKCLLNMLMYICHEDSSLLSRDLAENPQRGTFRHGPLRSRRTWAKKRKRREVVRKEFIEKVFPNFTHSDLIVAREIRNPIAYEKWPWLPRKEWVNQEVKNMFIAWSKNRSLQLDKEVHLARKAQVRADRWRAEETLKNSVPARTYFHFVADLFGEALRGDIDEYHALQIIDEKAKRTDGRNGSSLESGLFAKWAPTPNGMHDKKTPIVDAIVERVFPKEKYKLPDGTDEEYLSFMRQRYQRDVLSPLRRYAEVPEHFVGRGEWDLVNYKRMASRCRMLYGEKVHPSRSFYSIIVAATIVTNEHK